MKLCKVLLWTATVVMVLAGGAQAGITNWTNWWVDDSSLDPANSTLDFDQDTYVWAIGENYVAGEPDTNTAGCGAETDVDPIIHVVKTITNSSSFVWTGYQVVISGSSGVGYIAGSADSDVFETVIEDGNTIDFCAPQSVGLGEDVTIEFDVLIPTIGQFNFNISQTPIPEPATMGLLAFIGVGLLKRRSRR